MPNAKLFNMDNSMYISGLYVEQNEGRSAPWRTLNPIEVRRGKGYAFIINPYGYSKPLRQAEAQHAISIIKDINKHGIPGNIKRRENHQPQPNRTQLQRGLNPPDQPAPR